MPLARGICALNMQNTISGAASAPTNSGGKNMAATKLIAFAAGVLAGTAGIKILTSKDAKKAYTHATAAVLRGKDCVVKTYTTAKENCGDILADAKAINEERAAKEVIEDEAQEAAEADETAEA